MKKSMIERLYFEDFGWVEKMPMNEAYRKLSDEHADMFDRWDKEGDEETKVRLDKLWTLGADMEAEASYLSFAEGFKFGFRLAMEVLAEQEE